MRRKIAMVMALVMTVFAVSSTGCIGRMALSGKVMKFNLEASENKWGRELIFLVLYIIPVYPFAGFIDLLIINSIEFHTGTNPISDEARLARKVIVSPEGARGESVARPDGSIALELTESDGTHHSIQLRPIEGGYEMRDADGNYLGHVDREGRMFSREGEVEMPQS
jgi:hypothetical protein